MRYSNLEEYIFDVGDEVYSRLEPGKKGKVINRFVDPILSKVLLGIEWDDKTSNLYLEDYIMKENPFELWNEGGPEAYGLTRKKEPIRSEYKDVKDKIEKGDISKSEFYKIFGSIEGAKYATQYIVDRIIPFIIPVIASEVGAVEGMVEEFLKISDFRLTKDNDILIKKGSRIIVTGIGEPYNIRYFKNYQPVKPIDFLKEAPLNYIVVKSVKNGYIVNWGADEFLMERDEFDSFIKDYGLNKGQLPLPKEGKELVKISF